MLREQAWPSRRSRLATRQKYLVTLGRSTPLVKSTRTLPRNLSVWCWKRKYLSNRRSSLIYPVAISQRRWSWDGSFGGQGSTQTSWRKASSIKNLDFRIYKNYPAVCLSACTLAYLGGVFRFLDDRSKYGVHRFFSTRQQFDSDAAQVVSSVVVQYIREMGADPNLFSQMTKAGKDEINVLARPQLEALGVVTAGAEDTRWTIESTGQNCVPKGRTKHGKGDQQIYSVLRSGTTNSPCNFRPT